jgi:nucleotide-binding universal stress UspA family protein
MKKILVPVDFNPLATAALRHAAQLAHESGAALIVMYADTFEPPAEFTSEQTETLAASIADSRRRTAEELDRYAHEHVPETLAMQTEVREALPVEGILAAIDEHQPDLVVMGTHGRGALSRLMFGSVAKAVLRATNVPVVTIDRAEASKP